jgi:hypothetical protein
MWVYERYKSGLTGFIYAPDDFAEIRSLGLVKTLDLATPPSSAPNLALRKSQE